MLIVTVEHAQERLDHIERIAAAGVEKPPFDMGPPVILWRKFRGDGRETTEVLPKWLAECTLAMIPEREPNVERASLRTHDHNH